MKTLLLAPEIFSSEGGIARILRLYLKGLCDFAERTGETGLLALNDASFDSRELRRYGNHRLTAWYACNGHKLRFVRAARRMSTDVDVIICGHVAQLPAAWWARCFRRKLRYALIAHGLEVWRPFNLLEKIALRGAWRIWCVSDYTRRELLRFAPYLADRAVVLPNAYDPFLVATSPSEGAASTDYDLLAIARLSAADNYKGIDHLIEAMPAVLAQIPAARLRIVGRGDDATRLRKVAEKKKVGHAVKFLGYLSDDDMHRELRDCRAFALPSLKEGFGLVYVEAMAHGKPCIGVRRGGAAEIITPATGTLVEYGDVPAIANALVYALNRPWDPQPILDRAAQFSYSVFREKLAIQLSA